MGVWHEGRVSAFRAITNLWRQLSLPLLLARSQSDMRLLKHYESGLPAWAIVLPSYGLFYR